MRVALLTLVCFGLVACQDRVEIDALGTDTFALTHVGEFMQGGSHAAFFLSEAAWKSCPDGWDQLRKPERTDDGPFGGTIWHIRCKEQEPNPPE